MSEFKIRINSTTGNMYIDKPDILSKFPQMEQPINHLKQELEKLPTYPLYITSLQRYNQNFKKMIWGGIFLSCLVGLICFIPSIKKAFPIMEEMDLCMKAWIQQANEVLGQIKNKYFQGQNVFLKIELYYGSTIRVGARIQQFKKPYVIVKMYSDAGNELRKHDDILVNLELAQLQEVHISDDFQPSKNQIMQNQQGVQLFKMQ